MTQITETKNLHPNFPEYHISLDDGVIIVRTLICDKFFDWTMERGRPDFKGIDSLLAFLTEKIFNGQVSKCRIPELRGWMVTFSYDIFKLRPGPIMIAPVDESNAGKK